MHDRKAALLCFCTNIFIPDQGEGRLTNRFFQRITSNGRYGDRGFGSGRYRLKNRFFSRSLVIVKPPISIKNGTNVFLLT